MFAVLSRTDKCKLGYADSAEHFLLLNQLERVLNQTDQNTVERKTRSGRKISGTGTKRARDTDVYDEEFTKKSKMDPQMEQLKSFFSKELDTKLHNNRKEIVADNKESLKSLTMRIDATQTELQSHKEKMQEELNRVHEKLNALAPGQLNPSATYEAAAGCYSGETSVALINGNSNPVALGNDLLNAYWTSRRSARIASIAGSSNRELWSGLQEFFYSCLLYTSPSPRDLSTSRMPSSA